MKLSCLFALLALSFSATTYAQGTSGHVAHHGPEMSASAADAVDGEVRKVDKELGKVTLKHGPIPNLDMTGMTMVFRVSDPKLLDTIQVGDKVRFQADKINGAYTVTFIEVAQ